MRAFQKEDFIPPENELKSRVDFYYTRQTKLEPPAQFWKREGKEWYDVVQEFIGKRKGVERAAGEIVSPSEPPEAKLRRLYARVQQVRNLSYERSKTKKEEEREKLKDNESVEDVWKHGYGYRNQLNRLFVGLARAAGFEAWSVRVSQRDAYFFREDLQDGRQLDGEVALVRLEGKDLYFDPGTQFCPFGLLSWENTGVRGIRLEKDGGVFVTTPNPSPADAATERKATLEFSDDGTLVGMLTVIFRGHEAMSRRREASESDDAGRRKQLEDEINEWLPAGARVELTKAPDWTGSEPELRAEFSLRVSSWGTAAGRRWLLPVSLFGAGRQTHFRSANRIHPLYFEYPVQVMDEISVRLPLSFQVSNTPTPQRRSGAFGQYEIACETQGNTLKIQRRMATNGVLIPVEYYSGLRTFFESVRSSDEEQVVLQPAQVGQRN